MCESLRFSHTFFLFEQQMSGFATTEKKQNGKKVVLGFFYKSGGFLCLIHTVKFRCPMSYVVINKTIC